VGVVSGVIRVNSPAPIVALLGLFGMVLGEQAAKEEIRCLQKP
jgi:XapX domain-containing protein